MEDRLQALPVQTVTVESPENPGCEFLYTPDFLQNNGARDTASCFIGKVSSRSFRY